MKNGLKLQEIWNAYDTYTGKVSEITRQLSFAGIAVIWFFKTGDNYKTPKQDWFLSPLILFVLALAFDLLQYIVGSIIWKIYAMYQERKQKKASGKIDLDEEYDPSYWWTFPMDIFFFLKAFLTIAGYVLLIKYVRDFLSS